MGKMNKIIEDTNWFKSNEVNYRFNMYRSQIR